MTAKMGKRCQFAIKNIGRSSLLGFLHRHSFSNAEFCAYIGRKRRIMPCSFLPLYSTAFSASFFFSTFQLGKRKRETGGGESDKVIHPGLGKVKVVLGGKRGGGGAKKVHPRKKETREQERKSLLLLLYSGTKSFISSSSVQRRLCASFRERNKNTLCSMTCGVDKIM